MYFQVLDSFLHSQWKKIFLNILLISAYPCFAVFFFLFCVSAGLEILAFPCNQFGAQEPGDNEQIQEFACTRFKAEFPIFDKVLALQLYKFYKQKIHSHGFASACSIPTLASHTQRAICFWIRYRIAGVGHHFFI